MNTTKWREPIIDPYSITFNEDLELKSIDGYPHAGNDVFKCRGLYKNNKIEFFLKVSRHSDANINNELKALKLLKDSSIPTPEIITYDLERENPYLVTKSIEGQRLSRILINLNETEIVENSLKYLKQFGMSLGKIHSLNIKWEAVKKRKFHRRVKKVVKKKLLKDIDNWLEENEPKEKEKIFIHGDHHYANILWLDEKITGVLDWELCGIGWKEFDLAWSLILRPSQKFLKTEKEEYEFLAGYSKYNSFNMKIFEWCKVLIYFHFYGIGKNIGDTKYLDFVRKKMTETINKSIS